MLSKEELYNLKLDSGEENDLSDKNLSRKKELEKMLDEWIESTNAPVPTEVNPKYDEEAIRNYYLKH